MEEVTGLDSVKRWGPQGVSVLKLPNLPGVYGVSRLQVGVCEQTQGIYKGVAVDTLDETFAFLACTWPLMTFIKELGLPKYNHSSELKYDNGKSDLFPARHLILITFDLGRQVC
ncbi:hypothetical protein STEG23_003882, partial [Scotinomys teguina]